MVTQINSPSARTHSEKENLEVIYEKAFPAIAGFVSKMGGSLENAKDIFHDSLILWIEQGKSGRRQIRATPESYLLGIARHLWYRQHAKNKFQHSASDLESIEMEAIEDSAVSPRLMNLLERSGKACLELLQAFYYQNFSVAEIASAFGFGGNHSATVQKYKCLEKVRNLVKEKSLGYEDFLD